MGSMGGMISRVLFFTLSGLAAGLLTWFVSDVSGFVHISDSVGTLSPAEARSYWGVFMVWGGAVGTLLAVADALLSGARAEWHKVIGMGLGVGILSGLIGGAFGMTLFGPLYVYPARTPFDFLRNVLARAIGWAFIGALAGTASGWRKLSVRVGRNGFIGGLVGGILGGATFEIIPYLIPGIRPGPVSRLFGFAITGAMIGLFIALVQELLKEAWMRVVVGRNEGKEILIEKAETRIGRAELADIPLFGDPSIARTHAVLVAGDNGRFTLRDTGESQTGVFVNGERIASEKMVRSGDQIQVGSRLMVFYERMTRERTAPAPKDVAEPRSAPRPVELGGLPSLADLPQAGVGTTPSSSSASPYAATAPNMQPFPSSLSASTAYVPRLVATSGPHQGATFDALPGAVIGRDPGVNIALPNDSKVSRSHARIVADASGVAVEDAGSSNGTYVNGRRVTGRIGLALGDTVLVGQTALRLE